jgi:hypothetical protein
VKQNIGPREGTGNIKQSKGRGGRRGKIAEKREGTEEGIGGREMIRDVKHGEN